MRILITGGTGFIGRNLVEYFEKEHDVLHPTHDELDLTNEELVYEYLKNNQPIDLVVHAANSNMTNSTGFDILNINLRMFYNIEKHCDLYGKMLYLSSGAVYGRDSLPPMVKEEDFGRVVPTDSYGFTKYIIHKEIERSSNIYELILFGVYGRYEEWERRFISNAVCMGLKGLPITINKNVIFDYLWVEDLARIIQCFLKNTLEYKYYNVCTSKRIDLLTLAHIVKEELGYKGRIEVFEEGFKPEYTGDNTRLMGELGDFEFTSLEKGIRSLIRFYKIK